MQSQNGESESNKGSYTRNFKHSPLPFSQELTSGLGLYCEAKLNQRHVVLNYPQCSIKKFDLLGPPTDLGSNSLPLHSSVSHSTNDKKDPALFSQVLWNPQALGRYLHHLLNKEVKYPPRLHTREKV